MPTSKKHFWIGAGVTGVAYLLYKLSKKEPIDLLELLGIGLIGGSTALLPDMLEPATNPQHRRFFHSITALLLTLSLNNNLQNNSNVDENTKNFIKLLTLGYGSHLIADSTTPASIPSI